MLHELRNCDVRLVYEGMEPRNHFAQVVGWDACRNADSNARGSVDEQVRHPGRQNARLLLHEDSSSEHDSSACPLTAQHGTLLASCQSTHLEKHPKQCRWPIASVHQAQSDAAHDTDDDTYAQKALGTGKEHGLYLRAVKIGCKVYSLKVQVSKEDG